MRPRAQPGAPAIWAGGRGRHLRRRGRPGGRGGGQAGGGKVWGGGGPGAGSARRQVVKRHCVSTQQHCQCCSPRSAQLGNWPACACPVSEVDAALLGGLGRRRPPDPPSCASSSTACAAPGWHSPSSSSSRSMPVAVAAARRSRSEPEELLLWDLSGYISERDCQVGGRRRVQTSSPKSRARIL